MEMSARFEKEVAVLSAAIPPGARVGVIGSTSFWHAESGETCGEIGELLVRLPGLVLLTGGVSGAGESVGRSYTRGCANAGRVPSVVHVLPRGFSARDYGTTLLAGDGMAERREVLGRLAKIFIVVEGGPGTAHEARVALAHGAQLVPVARSGGHAGEVYPTLQPPRVADARAWDELGRLESTPSMVAAAVVEIVSACLPYGL